MIHPGCADELLDNAGKSAGGSIGDLQLTDNATGETKNWENAWIAGWVQDPIFWYDPVQLDYISIGVDVTDQTDIMPDRAGYWIYTLRNNLTLVLP